MFWHFILGFDAIGRLIYVAFLMYAIIEVVRASREAENKSGGTLAVLLLLALVYFYLVTAREEFTALIGGKH